MTLAEKGTDLGGLRNQQISIQEERRRERGAMAVAARDKRHHGVDAAAFAFRQPRHVAIGRFSRFQDEAHIFAAARNHRPIIEIVGHTRSFRAAS